MILIKKSSDKQKEKDMKMSQNVDQSPSLAQVSSVAPADGLSKSMGTMIMPGEL